MIGEAPRGATTPGREPTAPTAAAASSSNPSSRPVPNQLTEGTPVHATPEVEAAHGEVPTSGGDAGLRPQGAAPSRERKGPDALHLPLVDETLAFLEAENFLDRLWIKDTSLWEGDPGRIANGLGWLTAPTIMRAQVEDLQTSFEFELVKLPSAG